MRYLTTALISEGPTDDRFLPRLLSRSLYDVCATEFHDSVEIADVVPLRRRSGPPGPDEILRLADEYAASFLIVFVHRDQGANRERFDREYRTPLSTRWPSGEPKLVMVVPVRETEAWVLADGDALRRALGVRWSDRELGVPTRAKDVERIEYPKIPLARLGARIGRPPERYFERVSELVSLKVLGQVASFQRWRADVTAALTGLGFRRKELG